MYSRIHVSVPGMTACIGFCPWYHQMTCRAGRRDGSVKNSTGESAAALPHRSYHFTGEIPDRRLLEINEGAIPRNRRLQGNGAVHNVNSGKSCLDFFTKKEGGTFVPPSCKCQILAEVSLKQTSKCFSVSCFVFSHFISHFASLVTSKPLYYKGFLIFYKKHRCLQK